MEYAPELVLHFCSSGQLIPVCVYLKQQEHKSVKS